MAAVLVPPPPNMLVKNSSMLGKEEPGCCSMFMDSCISCRNIIHTVHSLISAVSCCVMRHYLLLLRV